MKYFLATIILVVLTAFALAENTLIPERLIKHARKIQNYCKKQTNVADELIEKGRQKIFVNDRAMQCFIQCNLDIGGMMNSKNEISVEPLQQLLPEDWYLKLLEASNKCGTKDGADACEIAYNTAICFAQENKDYPMLL